MTFGKFSNAEGWVFHYKPKNPPLTLEMQAALDFMGGFTTFSECPEFDFEPCAWRFLPAIDDGYRIPGFRNTHAVHEGFDAHAEYFSMGIEKLLSAHTLLNRYNLSFLRLHEVLPAQQRQQTPRQSTTLPERFDVALSFAGTDRAAAETLATIVRDAGYAVFYDNFYDEQLWGKDLYVFFDEIYRKKARFCVMFISQAYCERMWTNHERQSAQARALEEKGGEYILPIEVEQVELPGLRPTIKRIPLSAERSIEDIAQILISKLQMIHK